MRKYYVYQHIRLDNNEVFYIGKGCRSRHVHKAHRNKYWKNIVNKVGFRAEKVIQNLTNEEACQLEINLIAVYRSLGFCKANISSGGESGTNGVKPWHAGKRLTKDHAYKCGKAFRGKKRPAHSKFMKEYYKTHPVPAKGKPAVNRQAVVCLNTGELFESMTIAANRLGITRQNISQNCRKLIKKTKGYMFEYHKCG